MEGCYECSNDACVPSNVGKFLTGRRFISFSRNSLLAGVRRENAHLSKHPYCPCLQSVTTDKKPFFTYGTSVSSSNPNWNSKTASGLLCFR